jgi:hypothetical protein
MTLNHDQVSAPLGVPQNMPKVSSQQVAAALTIAIASLRHSQECLENWKTELQVLTPDHFDGDASVGSAEIDRAIDILNSLSDVLDSDSNVPEVGAPGWLNAAISSYKPDDTF